jgi:hypothetical protein
MIIPFLLHKEKREIENYRFFGRIYLIEGILLLLVSLLVVIMALLVNIIID